MNKLQNCTYCGSTDVHGWQGKACWCGSPRCHQRHYNSTYEPCFFLPPMSPTLFEMALILIAHTFFGGLCKVTPVVWLLPPVPERSKRMEFARWVFGTAYWWGEQWARLPDWMRV